ncbi:DUF6929 family protein [Pararhodonellum marinum]|uniref:DUF6929 family protein n=1 Tax=Pararhodonellum marinum TaxID=2755358 RepID=UPI00188F342E|nr:hypothetical protein [Pararhodonellum marinum]
MNKQPEFTLSHATVLENIPSASGVCKIEDRWFVIGDDSPYLFELDSGLSIIGQISIFPLEDLVESSIPKALKPDFEAMESVNGEIWIFGSGSKSPERDIMVKVNPNQPIQVNTYSMLDFYAHLKSFEEMKGAELNLEAFTVYKKDFYLLNRANNLIFRFNGQAFYDYLSGKGKIPHIDIFKCVMPKINGIAAGFSGATFIYEDPFLIFTASVEDTPNAYDDGEVLGSFIGIVALNKINQPEAFRFAPILGLEEPPKVESIWVKEKNSDRKVQLVMATDSDGGPSLWIEGELSW